MNAHHINKGGAAGPCCFVVFGANGDLTKRLLVPALYNLAATGLLPENFAIVGVVRRPMEDDAFRQTLVDGLKQFATRPVDQAVADKLFACVTSVVAQVDNPDSFRDLARHLEKVETGRNTGGNRLFYLATPPSGFAPITRLLQEVGLSQEVEGGPWRRVIVEKPFGTDLASAQALNRQLLSVLSEDQIYRMDHYLGKETVQNIMILRFANGLFEPIWNRNFIDHVQIDVPEQLGLDARAAFYEPTGAYKDMVVTHLFQIMAFVAMEPPTALEPRSISEEKDKVFRSLEPILPEDVVRGQYVGYRGEPGVNPDSDTETFIALRARIDNWRWAGVPFYLRTGKRMAEGMRIISIAFREAPKSMFPAGSGVGSEGPDHLTFDLADESKVSLSFYGKRPGPGMRLEKLSMQFSTQDTSEAGDVLEAYERLILDALRGDHTLFNTAEGIESLWERSIPLLDSPPPVRPYPVGTWGPNAIHQLIAPHAWRLPFERAWRTGE